MTRIASGFLYRTDVILEKIAIHKVMFFELANLQSCKVCKVSNFQIFKFSNFCDKREQSQVLLELCRVKQKSWAERKIFKFSNYCEQYTFFTPQHDSNPQANCKQENNKKRVQLLVELFCGMDGTRTRDPLRDRQVF